MADPDTTGKSPRKRASRKSPSSSSTDAVGAESRRKSTEALKPGSQLESEELQNVIGRGVVPPILTDPKRREEMGDCAAALRMCDGTSKSPSHPRSRGD
jgi:hypothetical protein